VGVGLSVVVMGTSVAALLGAATRCVTGDTYYK